jgi:hypothetical protein
MIAEVDQELEKLLRDLPRCEGAPEQMPPRTKACIYQRASNEPVFDLRHELFRIGGVDLTDVPGIRTNTAQTILTEVRPNVARFRNASAFASWLGLSPEKQVSGGKTLYTKTRKVKNRAAIALRLGASCLYHAKNYLGEFFSRMEFRLGKPQAITATAHQLARILYHMLRTKEPYSESTFTNTMNWPSHVLRPGCEDKPPDSAMCSSHKKRPRQELFLGSRLVGCDLRELVAVAMRIPLEQSEASVHSPSNPVQRNYCSFAYSTLASFRIGISGSASFQRARKS